MAKLTANERDENRTRTRTAKARVSEIRAREKISAAKQSETDRNAERASVKEQAERKPRQARIHGLTRNALREHGLHTSRYFKTSGCGSSDAED